MSEPSLRILHVGAADSGGGAAAIARNLVRGLNAHGCEAWLAVGRRATEDPSVRALADDARSPLRTLGYTALQHRLGRLAATRPGRGWGALSRAIRLAVHPRALVDQCQGKEDFEFPGSYDLLALTGTPADIVHCHNLHGGYFDLRALRWLSERVPTLVTLHDAWLLSGHCAHSFDCERWRSGCGSCPDLDVYPRIRRDATAANWQRKRDIYSGSRLYVATPCDWLMRRVGQSMLAPAIQEARVIPYGIDLSIFRPLARNAARHELGLPLDVPIVLLPIGRLDGPWADTDTLRTAMQACASTIGGRRGLFVAVGHLPRAYLSGAIETRELSFTADPATMARYYRAADVYVHCARADTFPCAVLEAMACGTPVVASAVGGIPDQISSMDVRELRSGTPAALDRATGILVPSADAGTMADALTALITHEEARAQLGRNAARDVRERFDLERHVERYLDWYRTIIEHWNGHAHSGWNRTPTRSDRPNTMALD